MANKILSQERKNEILETCFNCYCEHGLENTGTKALAQACNMSTTNLFFHFGTIDNIIIQSTSLCLSKIEKQFIDRAPTSEHGLSDFLLDVPYWTAREYGKKFRFMYQVYLSPKYIDYGKQFFKDITIKYTQYAKKLEKIVGLSWVTIRAMLLLLMRASVNFALFGDEEYLKPQMDLLIDMVRIYRKEK